MKYFLNVIHVIRYFTNVLHICDKTFEKSRLNVLFVVINCKKSQLNELFVVKHSKKSQLNNTVFNIYEEKLNFNIISKS